MKKNNIGQISLDLIFSLLIVVIVIITINFFITDFYESKENINLENKLKIKTIHATNFINNSRLMLDTEFETSFLITRILYKNNQIFPQINIDNEEGIIEFEYNNKKISKKFNNKDIVVYLEGEYLVVRNE